MRRRQDLSGYLFILPALAIIILFRFYPILQAIRMSFFKWGMAGPLYTVGLKNFGRLLIDTKFYQALGNTFWYVAFAVPLTIILSILFAQMLNQKIPGRGFYRTIYYLPVVTSIVAISVVWKWIFNPDRGVLNALFGIFGIEGLKWLNDSRGIIEILLAPFGITASGFFAGPSIALCALIIMAVWHNTGYCVIIALAGLQNVPGQYYEAARIDGAGPWKTFRHVTLPLISPTIFYLMITQSIFAFNTFTPIYVMTQPPGGPLGTTNLVVFYLYEQAFRLWNLGYANAIAFVIFIIIFILTQFQKRFIERRVHYE
ncbi:MAG: sugar ABC transporter permease [candidate division WOR-3 bacterium]|nr:MAG: sugar ABC transporter permease [candidate division WOR-3 bacterium]